MPTTITIRITTAGIAAIIAEARDKLDRWLAKFPPPGKYQTQDIRLTHWTNRTLTYELEWRQMDCQEYKQAYLAKKRQCLTE